MITILAVVIKARVHIFETLHQSGGHLRIIAIDMETRKSIGNKLPSHHKREAHLFQRDAVGHRIPDSARRIILESIARAEFRDNRSGNHVWHPAASRFKADGQPIGARRQRCVDISADAHHRTGGVEQGRRGGPRTINARSRHGSKAIHRTARPYQNSCGVGWMPPVNTKIASRKRIESRVTLLKNEKVDFRNHRRTIQAEIVRHPHRLVQIRRVGLCPVT